MRALKKFVVVMLSLLVPCAPSSAAEPFAVILDAIEKIRAHYVEPVDERTVAEAAIDGLFALPRVDPRILDKKPNPKTARPTSPPSLPPAQDQNSTAPSDVARLDEVFTQIRRAYSKRIDDQSLVDAAIERMVDSLDAQSRYVTADQWRGYLVAKNIGEVGLRFKMDAGRIKIVRLVEASPADRAGVRPGDLLLAIDRAPVKGLSFGKIWDRLEGPLGSGVVLTLSRDGQKPMDVTLARAHVFAPSVRFRVRDDVACIEIGRFNELTVERLNEALAQLQVTDPKPRGVVIDLRDNAVGRLDHTIAVTELFLKSGLIVAKRGRDGAVERFEVKPENKPSDVLDGLPMAVLINESTASGAEVMAAALQDHGRAVVIGTPSFGQGRVQTVIPLRDEMGALRITTARLLRPSGEEIDERGVTPDTIVEWKPDMPPGGSDAAASSGATTDPQLAAAIAFLQKEQKP